MKRLGRERRNDFKRLCELMAQSQKINRHESIGKSRLLEPASDYQVTGSQNVMPCNVAAVENLHLGAKFIFRLIFE